MKRLPLLAALLAACGQTEPGTDPGGLPPRDGADGAPVAGDHEPAPCADERDWFVRELYRPVLAVQCIGCHTEGGTAAATRLNLVPETEPGWEEASFAAVRRVVRAELAGEPLLLLKPSLRHPDGHTGGRLVPEGSAAYGALEAFVERVRDPACAPDVEDGVVACDDVRPGRPLLRRLTPDEYDRTVRDLFGLEADYGDGFAADPVVDGFRNRAEALTVSPLLADQLRVAAEDVARRVAASPAALGACATRPDAGEACVRDLLGGFGTRVFRRPLTSEEINEYAALYAADGGTFAAGLELVLSAMLQSPHFLYRAELGDADGGLSPYETATALAYLVTGTTPDDALLAAAAAGALDAADGREAQARRLMAQPAHRERVRRFVTAWLDLDRLAAVPKDTATFPELTPAVREAMRRELDAFVDHAVFSGTGRLPELLTAGYTFVDDTLATFYGLTDDGRVTPQAGERAGLLTLGATLTVHSRPNDTSPIHRGKLVRERLLCQAIPPPPPGVVADPPPFVPGQRVRDRYAAHSQVQPCEGCHRLMDPIGFAFERFDGVGRWRDDVEDAAGEIVGSASSDGAVEGAAALGAHLGASAEVHDCFAREAFRFAYGIGEDAGTRCMLRAVQDEFRAGDLAVEALFVALARSPQLERRVVDEAPPPDPAPDAGPPDAGPAPDAAPPLPDLVVADTVESTWETGACHQVTVRNDGPSAVAWAVELDVGGTLTQHWECQPAGEAGVVTFRGAEWNADLAPGGETGFGFCVSR